jgi:hypothetical protein
MVMLHFYSRDYVCYISPLLPDQLLHLPNGIYLTSMILDS